MVSQPAQTRLKTILAVVCAAVIVQPALSQRPRMVKPRPQVRPLRAVPDASTQEAQRVIAFYLRQGIRQQYTGEQITRLLQPGGAVRETRQSVRYAGPGRQRMEYLAPAELRGETILISGGRFFHYKPSPENRIQEGVAPAEEFQARAREIIQGVRKGTVSVRVVGQELVAGHMATIVELRSLAGGAFYLKFWIDQATGVRLRYENLDPRGRVVSETFFTSVNYDPVFAPGEFQPNTLPNVPHEALLPERAPLPNVRAAQAQVGYTIREPAVPAGFHLSGVWVERTPPKRATTILRYTDGVNTYTIFETPIPPRRIGQAARAAHPKRVPRLRNGVVHWLGEEMLYTLIGNLRQDTVRSIVESLQ